MYEGAIAAEAGKELRNDGGSALKLSTSSELDDQVLKLLGIFSDASGVGNLAHLRCYIRRPRIKLSTLQIRPQMYLIGEINQRRSFLEPGNLRVRHGEAGCREKGAWGIPESKKFGLFI